MPDRMGSNDGEDVPNLEGGSKRTCCEGERIHSENAASTEMGRLVCISAQHHRERGRDKPQSPEPSPGASTPFKPEEYLHTLNLKSTYTS
jgi:hypothetical protein